MYIPITIATLITLTVAMVLLRMFWTRIPQRLGYILIRASIVVVVIHAIFVVTKWDTASERLNVIINWLALAGFELLVLLFTRLSPRWLTVPSAIILIVPLFASSIVIPLTHLFIPGSRKEAPIGNNFFYDVRPWSNSGGGNAGVDVLIYYHPRLVPFLRHKMQTIPFNNQECNSSAAFAVTGPRPRTVLGRCPRWPSQPAGTLDKLLPLGKAQ
jgi:hypothetical protein